MEERKSFAVIEFPGVLQNPPDLNKAIASLGGENAVRTSVNMPAAKTATPLTLNLRPGVGNSSSNIVAEKTISRPNLFVLQVTEEAAEEESGPGADGASSAKRSSQDVEPSSVKGTILGPVTAFTSFRSLADFQYHTRRPKRNRSSDPSSSDDVDNATSMSRDMQTMSELEMAGETIFRLATRRKDESQNQSTDFLIDRLRPSRFVRSNLDYGTTDYWFRQFGVNTEAVEKNAYLAKERGRALGEDRRSDANRLIALSHRISADAETVPQRPAEGSVKPPVVRGIEAFNALCEILETRFEERPIWIRRALHDGIPKRLRKSFKRAIPTVAYSFQGPGPFHQAWIRYGYDPRKDPGSRQFQVVEIRCNHPVVRAAIKERRMHLRAGTSEDDFKFPEAYTLSHIPLNKHNFVQVCDISIPSAVDFCKREETSASFDKKYGFFSEVGYQTLVKIIKSALVENSTQFIGTERSEKILLPYTRGSSAPKKKRARISLSQVMKPKDPGLTQKIEIESVRASGHLEELVGEVNRKKNDGGNEPKTQSQAFRVEAQGGDGGRVEHAGHYEQPEPPEQIVGLAPLNPVLADVEGYEILGDDGFDDSEDDDDEDSEADDEGAEEGEDDIEAHVEGRVEEEGEVEE